MKQKIQIYTFTGFLVDHGRVREKYDGFKLLSECKCFLKLRVFIEILSKVLVLFETTFFSEGTKGSWTPTDNSRICSAHFIGGKKSEDQHSESYNPMIFPNIHKKKISSPSRPKRLLKRREIAALKSVEIQHEEEDFSTSNFLEARKKNILKTKLITTTTSIACQTDPCIDDNYKGTENILFCWNGINDASTQTIITCCALKIIATSKK
ncbi:hypothetical protein NQ317_015544 [Molorchus minor]|uniref:THAP-type domain-containing protein n=1 Tax=Molorchus minor TaxID=1323400 RepID=A0ABQ9JNA2_9CUCU|nr:hypothetical protein NQ317_015544 [Molorchus minor]